MSADADFSAFERGGWNERATGYDRWLGRVTARTVDVLLDAAAVDTGTRVLDVACGPGYACAAAAARGARPVGADIAPIMINLARRHNPELAFVVASAEALPFADGSFDAVAGNFLVHHLADADRTVRELARVLAPAGWLALTAWDVPDRCRLVGVLVDAIAAVGAPPPPDLPAGPPFFRFSADDAFAALLTGAGLAEVAVRTISFAHPVASADDLWAGLIGGTVRTAALVLRQPDGVRRRIRAAFDRQVARYADGSRLALPVSVRLAAGRRP